MKSYAIAAVLLLAAAVSGCCQSPYFAYPRFDRPHGTVEYQRQLYSKFDPFPDPNVGPGIPDFRPADYQDPARDKSSLRVPGSYSNGYRSTGYNCYPNNCYPNSCCQ